MNFKQGLEINGMEIWLIYPLKKHVTTKWCYLCFMSLNVLCMLLSVLPLTPRHKGTCSHSVAGCRQCGKPESGRNAAEGCHSQQQAPPGWIAKLCLLQSMLKAKVHPLHIHLRKTQQSLSQWFQNDKFVTAKWTWFSFYIWSCQSESRHSFSLGHIKVEIQISLDLPPW